MLEGALSTKEIRIEQKTVYVKIFHKNQKQSCFSLELSKICNLATNLLVATNFKPRVACRSISDKRWCKCSPIQYITQWICINFVY